jgi:hypothetical protein
MSQDYLMMDVTKMDEYGMPWCEDEPLNPSTIAIDQKKARQLLSAYGALEFAIGTGDDFWCFDFAVVDLPPHGKRIFMEAVINSETGCFIQRQNFFDSFESHPYAAEETAKAWTEEALDWCADNDIRHSKRGWNQDPWYFYRAVCLELCPGDVPDFSARQRRMGGKRINRFCHNLIY